MYTSPKTMPAPRSVRLALVGLLLVLCAAGCLDRQAAGDDPTAGPLPGTEHSEDHAMDWERVESLKSEQKFEAASDLVAEIRAEARAKNHQETWTRALVEETLLRMALHGYETAVRFLREEPWPEAPVWRSVLDLYYANALITYFHQYSYQIRGRERVVSDETIDLESWTTDQIAQQAHLAFGRVWAQREVWGAQPLGKLAVYIEQNDYPARIRGTLRDAVTYMWAELLTEESLWRPRHGNETYLLDRTVLVEGVDDPGVDPTDPEVHPLRRLCAVLGDLERWHAEHGRDEAALEARLTRLNTLYGTLSADQDRQAIIDHLSGVQDDFDAAYDWWSMGQWRLADFLQRGPGREPLVAAHAAARAGRERHPESLGGRRCAHLVETIEAPAYDLEAMSTDAAHARSIRINHKNLDALYFRAWHYDLAAALEDKGRHDRPWPKHHVIEEWVDTREPDLAWSVDLAPTPDFASHATYATVPAATKGAYVVAASTRADFGESLNRAGAVHMIVSDLVLIVRDLGDAMEICARSGATGEPVSGTAVDIHRFRYDREPARVTRRETDTEGLARVDAPRRHASLRLFARKGDDLAYMENIHPYRSTEPRNRVDSFVYTDRSVYRPGQTLHWKVVAYRGGETPDYKTLPGMDVVVTLYDGNGDDVAQETLRTNDFGSVSGSFTVPRGRLLGHWSLRTSLDGHASVKIEEYKRPTFEVSLDDPASPLRLNRPATLVGRADYYFGLPVTAGEVVWQVTRRPHWPRWWWWTPPSAGEQTVATGRTTLDGEGAFEAAFTPGADERLGTDTDVSYSYALSAHVTDEGGETRSAERVFRLGFVSVDAAVESAAGFGRADEPLDLTVTRTDLNGTPRPGEGAWRLVELAQPERALLPAERPVFFPPEDVAPYRTPGDSLNPRWSHMPALAVQLAAWSDGRELARGELDHGEDGVGEVRLDGLPAGAYRLHYETRDDFGALRRVRHDLLVAGERATPLALPLVLEAEQPSVAVGGTVRLLVRSGLPDQELVLDFARDGRRFERRVLRAGRDPELIEIPVTPELRGGFMVRATALRDHQVQQRDLRIFVPWDDRRLQVEFATFRDRLRPGTQETFRVTVRDAAGDLDARLVTAGAAELLAYMYDRSLDVFAQHSPPSPMSLYPKYMRTLRVASSLGQSRTIWHRGRGLSPVHTEFPILTGDRLRALSGYGIGGMGMRSRTGQLMVRGGREGMVSMAMEAAPMGISDSLIDMDEILDHKGSPPESPEAGSPGDDGAPVEPRTNFAETAFFAPHLLLDEDGAAVIEFEVPDSVTEWNVWVHALTRDLRSGSAHRQTASVKELMVRPYLPRFLREGDRAGLKVVVNNAGETDLTGKLDFELYDPETEADLRAEFGLDETATRGVAFTVAAGGGTDLLFPILAPARVGPVVCRVTARAGDYADGEQRSLPVLPGRMHLVQSRFASLREGEQRELHFADMLDDDPTRIDEQLVVTVDAQLFYSVLNATPYLVDYPYECTEQLLNKFLSTGILTSLFDGYPAVARMAKELSARDTRLEAWEEEDPNRKLLLEETPWLKRSAGGRGGDDLIKVLDPGIARATRETALAKLVKAQDPSGGFPWWSGGRPSAYLTLYILHGFAKALEFGVDAPRDVIVDAWRYLHREEYDARIDEYMEKGCCWETITFLNYVLSCYPDDEWTGGVFTDDDRERMLDFSFTHWKEHAPLLKGYLSLTLARAGRTDDANLVFDSIMDSARTEQDLGTYWAPEDRAWLWYNDTIETHAFALRAMTELLPDDARRHGLVQWLLLNKKLNHWSSTRATAEVIYALVHYMEAEGALGARETVDVTIGPRAKTFVFEPDAYTGARNRVIVPGDELDPATMATVTVEKEGKGTAFASATWHFSTEKMPEAARGDLFAVERAYFRRHNDGDEWVLTPLAPGDRVAVGDQVEVQLSVSAKHAAEFVHLRDPRGAGFEPESTSSGHRWDQGLSYYEEIRDSGANFFFSWLPAGQYTLRYRLRAAMAGEFKAGPAVLQSMYAPEFTAYSAGRALGIE